MSKHEIRKAISKQYCSLFFKNIDWLRRKRGLSLRALKIELSDSDFKVSRQAIPSYTNIRKGGERYFQASTYYMAAFAHFFNEPLHELLSRNYEEDDRG